MQLVHRRLSRNNLIFEKPHVVEKYKTKHSVSLMDIHYHLVKLCIESRLPHLLYFYLDYWQ